MPSIPLYAWLPVSLLAAFYFGCLCMALVATGGRNRRRGGYLKRDVYAATKAGGQPTPATDITARISSYSGHGAVSEGAVIRARLAPQSRPTGRGWSGGATVDHGASGGRAHSAGSGSAVPPPWPQPWRDDAA